MQTFQYSRPTTVDLAMKAAAGANTAQQSADVRFIAGGTTLVDLMKLDVERPRLLVDLNGLPLDAIQPAAGGGLVIGALARNSAVAQHPVILREYPVLSEALLSGASPQLRNMATTGGNLLQRTRCVYFRDTAHACNKREPGTGCSAIGGHNRMLAILGTSKECIATNPSDQNVALTALEATIQIQGTRGTRSIPIGEFYLKPGATPHKENVLDPGDLIVSVTLPKATPGSRSVYLKLRDRAAYEFALASAAVVMRQNGSRIEHARVALGGVGTVPWRCLEAEHALEGQPATAATLRRAAEAALAGAQPASENGFKVELATRCLVRALTLSSAKT
ncbi:MAG: xanthine dehydrogenase family protein subunit M [Acidobacteriaceae bacterium]